MMEFSLETRSTKFLSWLSRFCLYLVIFLTPLFILPFTVEKFELNKYFLIEFLTLASLLSFLGRVVVLKNLSIKRTPLTIPLIFLWAALLLSSIFSLEPRLSFFGNFDQLGVSFFGLTALIVFYFLVLQHSDSFRQIMRFLYAVLASGTVAASYFIVRSTNILQFPASPYLPPANLLHATSSLLGVFLVVVLAIALGLLAMRRQSVVATGLVILALLASGVALVLISFKVVLILIALALCLLLVFFLVDIEEVRRGWASLIFALLVATIVAIFLGTPAFLRANLPGEVSLSQGVSRRIATSVLSSSLSSTLFGSGLSTFVYDYSRFRPTETNSTFVWSLRFSQPVSTATEWLTTAGSLGTLALIILLITISSLTIKSWVGYIRALRNKWLANQELSAASPLLLWGISSVWLTMTVALFLVNFNAVLWMLFWLLSALLMAASVLMGDNPEASYNFTLRSTPQHALIVSFGFILVFASATVGGIFLGQAYAAEVFYAKSLGKIGNERGELLQRAISFNGHRPIFHLALADTLLAAAVEQAQKNPNDPTAAYPGLRLAVNVAKQATEISPRNVATWEFLSAMYTNARVIAPDANQWSVSALEEALRLEPTNPMLYVSLGSAKMFDKDYIAAKSNFEKALEMKPDLLEGYVQLAALTGVAQNTSAAIAVMERGYANGGKDNAEFLVELGKYYFSRRASGDLALAELAFRSAVTVNPRSINAFFALATVSEVLGKKNLALDLYRQALSLDPGNQEVAKKIRSLE